MKEQFFLIELIVNRILIVGTVINKICSFLKVNMANIIHQFIPLERTKRKGGANHIERGKTLEPLGVSKREWCE